jgi:hypothetical protein
MEINEIENYFKNANEINMKKDFSTINIGDINDVE